MTAVVVFVVVEQQNLVFAAVVGLHAEFYLACFAEFVYVGVAHVRAKTYFGRLVIPWFVGYVAHFSAPSSHS